MKDTAEIGDGSLAQAAAAGDLAAFEALVRRYQHLLYRDALGYLGSHDEALDAVAGGPDWGLKALRSTARAGQSWPLVAHGGAASQSQYAARPPASSRGARPLRRRRRGRPHTGERCARPRCQPARPIAPGQCHRLSAPLCRWAATGGRGTRSGRDPGQRQAAAVSSPSALAKGGPSHGQATTQRPTRRLCRACSRSPAQKRSGRPTPHALRSGPSPFQRDIGLGARTSNRPTRMGPHVRPLWLARLGPSGCFGTGRPSRARVPRSTRRTGTGRPSPGGPIEPMGRPCTAKRGCCGEPGISPRRWPCWRPLCNRCPKTRPCGTITACVCRG